MARPTWGQDPKNNLWVPTSAGRLDGRFPLGGGSPGGGGIYDWGEVTHVVSPTATSPGTGSEASPFTWQQARDFNPNGQHAHLMWLPGRAEVTASSSQYGSLRPAHNGTAQHPYVWSAQYDPRVGDISSHTIIGIPEGSYGSQFGLGTNNVARTSRHFVLDKFRIDESNNIFGEPGESGSIALRQSDHVKITRCLLGQGNKAGPFFSNVNIIFSQYCDFVEIADCVFHRHTNASGSNEAAIETYDINDWDIHHNTFLNDIGSHSLFIKGQAAGAGNNGFRIRYHHNLDQSRGGLRDYAYIGTAVLADAVWIYQNIMENAGPAFQIAGFSAGAGSHPGTTYAHNLIRSEYAWRWWVSNSYGDPQRFWNNIVESTNNTAFFENGEAGDSQVDRDRIISDYNLWRPGPRILVAPNTATLAWWQGQGKGLNSLQAAADYDQITYAPNPGATQINMGRDFLQLLGGADTAPINVGPYVQAGDEFGARGL